MYGGGLYYYNYCNNPRENPGSFSKSGNSVTLSGKKAPSIWQTLRHLYLCSIPEKPLNTKFSK